ncbi:[acyl-carrier-protein] S-malonyltransferase [Thermodesulfobium acidiphilum]|uniref:Malonyl CoA-acyl carrier protein transacylase n=1 Tax=Thermodesulfobium acidiphilum TaxID=1794699 RepID=A0A2R4W202_THEAF|nr:ACP S-malonyltransferase [Thermodesulfobium acidiphilum]AWB10750.1 [acyl-carrier-protein] S-malonyltransferase [Thermodesulfobium acidiphilum]PMP86015.1 MAG: malonyl CoA-acyl carrier protein transacylase [Thermodesulfobium narugense]
MSKKTVLLFPGQGSQYLNMHLKLSEKSQEFVRKILEDLNLTNILKLMSTSEESLLPTNVSQVAILVTSLGFLKDLSDRGFNFEASAGHSLGEYGALVAADVLSFKDALRCVYIRGHLMGECAARYGGSMVALLGFEREMIEHICKEASRFGICVVANENSTQQIVISGENDAIGWVLENYKKFNIKKAIKLKVEGAFHSPLMEDAAKEFKKFLESLEFKDFKVPVYKNIDGLPYKDTKCIPDILSKQIISPVKWIDTIENIIRDGYENCVEVGPKNILTTMLRRWTKLECSALDGE